MWLSNKKRVFGEPAHPIFRSLFLLAHYSFGVKIIRDFCSSVVLCFLPCPFSEDPIELAAATLTAAIEKEKKRLELGY